jgi:putative nucleotidyltransferase with HDIG domain
LIVANVFLVLFAYPLILLLERLFGFVSPITLLELSDMNRSLLQKLARQAPGTWQHSLNVANMAEQAARAIGSDALLVKTAALYHDIGKIVNPEYFIENQNGPNPHERLNPKESAAIIINHVADGVRLARQAGLPEVIIDFIRTHHGTSRAEFFYRTYAKDHQLVDDAAFRYPGPRPATKEQTILMIADTVEAACKSLKTPTETELYAFIDTLIKGKLGSGQLEESRLSFRELEVCRDTFKSVAKSVYHARIAYPEEE